MKLCAIHSITGQIRLRSGLHIGAGKDTVEIGIQINGKIRARIELPTDLDKEAVEAAVLQHPDVKPLLEGKTVRKVIVVKNIVNIVAA